MSNPLRLSRAFVLGCLSALHLPSIIGVCIIFATALPCVAQQFSPQLFQDMKWRMIGPFRGGRTRAVSGVPGQPNVFYIGAVNGGVWKTTDYGHTWTPLFDAQPTGSIGAIAVSLSDPNVIYVGSGEGLHRPDLSVGDGIYKSTDAGRTWAHLGLRDGQQIPQLAIDPRDPNRLFVAVLGHPYGPNEERGIFRSTDGGRTFEKVLYIDQNTGGSDVQIDPANPTIIYAAMWEAREGPWENAAWSGTSGGIFKSTDGGTKWTKLTKGLPEDFVQANIAIAPSAPNRLYATIASKHDTPTVVGLYRSDDAGESWYQVTQDTRPRTRIGGGGEIPVPKVDPKNPDIVYVASIVAWKSNDGGKTWTGFRGAPGGDDYQNIWINPNNTDVFIMVSDQGAIVTVNGGQTWSSWYNQPTAQLYHVDADNDFPYRVCSGQQESGSVCIKTRGNDGEITFRDWHPVGAEEYGYVAPDPLNPNIIFGGKISRYDRRTGQTADVSPKPLRGGNFRVLRTEPVVFSPVDPHILYFASNTLWQTRDGGETWQQISPDLSRKTWEVPASVGKYRAPATGKVPEDAAKPSQRGVIYAIAPSPLQIGRIWAGTDDGLIHVTTDGGANWTNVTPSQLTPWMKVSVLEASHFDPQEAYAAINTLRLDDMRPHILRTRDGGKTWTEMRNGIPDGAPVNAVREDTKRRGLLFAGTERQTYVSFDDGDHWQSLRLNMPATSVRDLMVKNDDLVVATHGRGFWVLDDITPLRQLDTTVASADTFLFKPQEATRVRWNMNTDTPLPPDVPAGKNPPDGAIIDYYLKAATTEPVTIEILDSAGQLVRRHASTDPAEPVDPQKLRIPLYWVRPAQNVPASAGIHRFLWDMHYAPVPGISAEYPISAVAHDTAPQPTSPWVMPGTYTVKVTANGKSYSQPLVIKMDPRVKTPAAALEQQFTLSKQVYEDLKKVTAALNQARSARAQFASIEKRVAQGAAMRAIVAADDALAIIEGQPGRAAGSPTTQSPETLSRIESSLRSLLGVLQDADVAPTAQTIVAVRETSNAVQPLLSRWEAFKRQQLAALNDELEKANLPQVNPEAPVQALKEDE